jgi:hypothetical protein
MLTKILQAEKHARWKGRYSQRSDEHQKHYVEKCNIGKAPWNVHLKKIRELGVSGSCL